MSKRTIGYYESWSNTRQCQKVTPEDLNLAGFTHINFAFSFFDPSSFQITSMDSNAALLYSRFTGLKAKASSLETWISVGGWSFTDPGSTQSAFSDMTSSQGNRAKFIQGLIQFMSTYGFDGVDLDWEYPGADDRGGKAADTENYVAFVKELKAAFGSKYGISMTLPTSYWYLQHFDLSGIQQHVDWFNLMAYDLHGVWDKASRFVGPYIAPHTNITEIDLGLDLLWRAGVTPDKVVLGQGWYGRSFTLSSPSCNTPNGVCQFSGPANAGPCSNAAGILDNQEIIDIISKNNLQPVWDHTAGVKWITWGSNQWVSYDDTDTFQQKRDFANKRCLSGLMVWAMDQVDQSASNGLGQPAGVTLSQQNDANQMSVNQQAGLTCRYTDCGESCPSGSTEVAASNGQPGQLSTSSRCKKGKYRALCCDDGTTMGKCNWRGFRGAGLSCMGGCADGDTEITTNTNNHDKKTGDQTCNGGLQSYCCTGFKPAPSKKKLVQDAKDAAKEAAEAAAEQAALDLAAKAFCRVAVPALLAPLELAEDLIPFIGEILDIAEIAATPALIKLCVKGIEKEGKAEFKVFGKKHSLSMDKPTVKPSSVSRPPETSHNPPRTTTKDDSCSIKGRGLDKRVNCLKPVTSYTETINRYQTITKTCSGARWPQACFHYSSAAARNARFNPLTCSTFVPDRKFMQGGTATAEWSGQHNTAWRQWMRRPQARCQRDEWPPQKFWQGDPGQLIRYNHLEDNTGAGSLWNSFCPEHAEERCEPGSERVEQPPGRKPETTRCKRALTQKVMFMSFDNDDVPLAQEKTAGLAQNECYPRVLIDDPTFALLNSDPYFKANSRAPDARWADSPDPALINGRAPPFPPAQKRDLSYLDPEMFIFDNGTVSRKPTPEELEEVAARMQYAEALRALEAQVQELAHIDCRGDSCATQLTPLGRASITVPTPARTVPSMAEATITTAEPLITKTTHPS